MNGFYKINVKKFKERDESVIEKMKVIIEKEKYEKGRDIKEEISKVKKNMKENVEKGKVGKIDVDKGYIVFEKKELKYDVNVEDE
jgi:hypothetical protein